MNKAVFFVLLLFCLAGMSYGISAYTPLTNRISVSGNNFISRSTNNVLTVGPIYGLAPVFSYSNVYYAPPSYTLKVPMAITNGANDADSNASFFVQFLSNESGYSGSNWSCYIELAGTNAGTNYDIPVALFGEGAIFNFNLAIVLPLIVSTNSVGFALVSAHTVSNTGHIAAVYTGMNGVVYGGSSNVTKQIKVNVSYPNHVDHLFASDGIDTITVFNGSKGLRRTAQTITVDYAAAPVDINTAQVWYDVDNTADGPGGANPNDKMVKMKLLSGNEFSAVIDDTYLGSGNILSFVLQLDGINYGYGSFYDLLSLASQDKYETVLLHNVIARGSGDLIYVNLPSKVLGKNGRILVYSVSRNLVATILNGTADRQMISWDGNDSDRKQVAKGLYYIMFDFTNLKEVRKVFVK
jgi:hypothetical protein